MVVRRGSSSSRGFPPILRRKRSLLSEKHLVLAFACLILALQVLTTQRIHHRISISNSNNNNNNSNTASPSSTTTTTTSVSTTTTTTSTTTPTRTTTPNTTHTLQQYYDEAHSHTLLSHLPDWLQTYVAWHGRMRHRFPGRQLFDHPDAPPLLLRTCLGLCGGLNDRIGQLDWDLYLANATGRLLLLHWHRPVPIEHFLRPAGWLDWSVPRDVPGFFPSSNATKKEVVRVSREGMQAVRAIPELFAGMPEDHPDEHFWRVQLDAAVARDANSSPTTRRRVVRHRILGHVAPPGELARRIGSSDGDMIPLGRLFALLFVPSAPVQRAFQAALPTSPITTEEYPPYYHALHLRVRHPKAVAGMVKGKNADYPADKTGLPWTGETKERAIATAESALECVERHFLGEGAAQPHPRAIPLYVCADSNDLVQYLVDHQSNNTTTTAQHHHHVLFARPAIDQENAHIDKQKGRDPEAYYSTFIDLLLAANAACIGFGVGNYGLLASRLSGTPCRVRYQKEAWGEQATAAQSGSASSSLLPLCQVVGV